MKEQGDIVYILTTNPRIEIVYWEDEDYHLIESLSEELLNLKIANNGMMPNRKYVTVSENSEELLVIDIENLFKRIKE